MTINYTRVTLRIPEDLYEKLRILAFESRKSQNQIIVEALAAYLKKES
ncbi:MAG: ribbon-helix-helix protein, CopG family [Clostridia bacterium]|nr:ribbon-helix-helix protein, CopG family [Clostridia bacterium]